MDYEKWEGGGGGGGESSVREIPICKHSAAPEGSGNGFVHIIATPDS